MGFVFLMVVVSILPHAGFGRNNHREDASHFRRLRVFFYPAAVTTNTDGKPTQRPSAKFMSFQNVYYFVKIEKIPRE